MRATRSKGTWCLPRTLSKFNPINVFFLILPTRVTSSNSSSIMAHPRLGIRPYTPEDLDKARFTVARSVMEPLAEANKRSPYLAISSPPNFKVLTIPFLRLLSPTHNRSVGRTIIRLYRIYGLVAEFPEIRRHSLPTYSHPCLRGRGRPDLVLFRLVSKSQIPR